MFTIISIKFGGNLQMTVAGNNINDYFYLIPINN